MAWRGGLMRAYLRLRRDADPWLLSAAIALPFGPVPLGIPIFVYLGFTGLYLVLFRPRTFRAIDPRYALAAAAFALAMLLLNLVNGSLPEDIRHASYPLYYPAMLAVMMGSTLIRDPLRQAVIGARLAIILLAIWSLFALYSGAIRYGFGTNPANAGFAIAFLAIMSRLPARRAPAALSNRFVWFYLSLLPVMATSTRAVLAVYAVALAWDVVHMAAARRRAARPRKGSIALAAASLVIIAVSGWLLAPGIGMRAADTTRELTALAHDPDPEAGGMPIRILLWRAAREVIAEHPVIGVGGAETTRRLRAHLPEAHRELLSQFDFSHSFVLDEWMQRGILGVILTLAFFAYGFSRVYRHGGREEREATMLVVLLALVFGSLHYLLLVDRHVALLAFYLALTTSANRGFRPPYRN